MINVNLLMRQLLNAALLLVWVSTAASAEPHAPKDVRMGLHILASVYADMQRKLADDQFDRLPHETQEFHEGSQALRDGVAHDPDEFKTQVNSQLQRSVAAADQVAAASKSRDRARVNSALTALAESMHELNALFPPALRSEPGTVKPPHHG